MITVDLVLGREPRVKGPEADKLRKDIQDELDAKHIDASTIEIPFEIPDLD